MNDLLIWIAFLVVYSIIQALGKKKKAATARKSPGTSVQSRLPASLQDALREIQETLQESQRPASQPQGEPVSRTKPEPSSPEPRRSPRSEPEFHTMETDVYKSNLEKKSRFEEAYSTRVLEKKNTLDQKFPTQRSYFDDSFHHAHPDRVKKAPSSPKKSSSKKALPDLLKNRATLAQAFLLQEILGKPVSRKSPDERTLW